MNAEKSQQDETAVAAIACFIRDAELMASEVADFLDQSAQAPGSSRRSWSPAYLIELGAVLRLRNWERAGIKDAIDPTLPSADVALAELVTRPQPDGEEFIGTATPLAKRVLIGWWSKCAHPNKPYFQPDVALVGVSRKHLLSCVAQLLWKLRDLETISTTQGDGNER